MIFVHVVDWCMICGCSVLDILAVLQYGEELVVIGPVFVGVEGGDLSFEFCFLVFVPVETGFG